MSATSVSDILGTIMNIVYVAFFVFSFFFSQKTKLGRMRDKTKQEIISAIPKDNSNEKNIEIKPATIRMITRVDFEVH